MSSHWQRQSFIAHALAASATLLPLIWLKSEVFAGNTDTLFYTLVLKLTARHMALGEWLPTWLPEANAGSGSPFAFFYNPLAYWLTAIVGSPFAVLDPTAWVRLLVGMVVAQVAGGLAALRWLSRHASPRSALVGSLLYTLFPYKLVYVYLHSNLAQVWALAFLPLLMIAAEDLAARVRGASVRYALWLAAVALSHVPTAIAFGLVPLLWAIVTRRDGVRQLAGRLATAHLMAAGLVAFYLVPAALNAHLLQTQTGIVGRFSYAENLGHRDLFLNFHYAIIGIAALGLLLRSPDLRVSTEGRRAVFWLAILAAVTFLCTRLALPIWNHVPILQYLQFPVARFHSVALIACTALSAFFLDHASGVRQTSVMSRPPAIFIPVAAMTLVVLIHVSQTYATARGLTWPYIQEIHRLNVVLPREYLTMWQPVAPPDLAREQLRATLPLLQVTQGRAQIMGAFRSARELAINGAIETETTEVLVRQAYWPTWQPTNLVAATPAGFIRLVLRRDQLPTTIVLGPLTGERESRMVSLAIGALALMALALARTTPLRMQHGEPEKRQNPEQ